MSCTSTAVLGIAAAYFIHETEKAIARLIYIFLYLVFLVSLYSMFLARRKLGEILEHKLRIYVYQNVFFDRLGSLPPVIYLTADDEGERQRVAKRRTKKAQLHNIVSHHLRFDQLRLSQCNFNYIDDINSGVYWPYCSGILQPQLSICFMFLLFLVARLIFVPLSFDDVSNEKSLDLRG